MGNTSYIVASARNWLCRFHAMRVGIFGSDDDLQCQAIARELGALGADNILLRDDALDQGLPLSVL